MIFLHILAGGIPVGLSAAACSGSTTEDSHGSGGAGVDAGGKGGTQSFGGSGGSGGTQALDAASDVDNDVDAGPCGKLVDPGFPGCSAPTCVAVDPSQLNLLDGGEPDGGFPDGSADACDFLCGHFVFTCTPITHDGGAWVLCQTECTGRRPAGFAPDGAATNDPGAYFAEMARLEAASITAFRTLARELRAHGAPRSLRRAARRAALDEIAHTRATRGLAEHFGASVALPRPAAPPLRELETIAVENAIEGCVRETFGALIAARQAQSAKDPKVRRELRRIARDELRHAALAWRVARWADRKLTLAEKAKVRAARASARDRLLRDLAGDPPRLLGELAGLPKSAELRRMASELNASIWA